MEVCYIMGEIDMVIGKRIIDLKLEYLLIILIMVLELFLKSSL